MVSNNSRNKSRFGHFEIKKHDAEGAFIPDEGVQAITEGGCDL